MNQRTAFELALVVAIIVITVALGGMFYLFVTGELNTQPGPCDPVAPAYWWERGYFEKAVAVKAGQDAGFCSPANRGSD